jgi:hypothetical protein
MVGRPTKGDKAAVVGGPRGGAGAAVGAGGGKGRCPAA